MHTHARRASLMCVHGVGPQIRVLPPSRLLAIAHHRGVRAVRWRWLVLCHTRVAPCEPRRRARDGARASARHADERAGGGRRLRSTPARTVSLHHRPVSCFLSSKTLSPKEKKAQTLSFFETPRKKRNPKPFLSSKPPERKPKALPFGLCEPCTLHATG